MLQLTNEQKIRIEKMRFYNVTLKCKVSPQFNSKTASVTKNMLSTLSYLSKTTSHKLVSLRAAENGMMTSPNYKPAI